MGLENQKTTESKTKSKKIIAKSISSEIKQNKTSPSRKLPLMATWEDDLELGFWKNNKG